MGETDADELVIGMAWCEHAARVGDVDLFCLFVWRGEKRQLSVEVLGDKTKVHLHITLTHLRE
jgi:hypothetical protein